MKQSKKTEAFDCFRKCVDISPEMALAFIKVHIMPNIKLHTHFLCFQECRKLGVECIVAPYEADAQLAYLSKEDLIDAVITEDSDLLVFGSKRVLFKMDESGNGKLIELKDIGRANKNLVVNIIKYSYILPFLPFFVFLCVSLCGVIGFY